MWRPLLSGGLLDHCATGLPHPSTTPIIILEREDRQEKQTIY